MEYANGGTLKSLIELKGHLPELAARKVIQQIVKAITQIYSKRLIHRDLKLENILVSFPNRPHNISKAEILNIDLLHENFMIKICDFGFNREF